MADRRPDVEDSGRVKRRKTENMDKSNFYLRGKNDSDDGGVPLFSSPNKSYESESNQSGPMKSETHSHDNLQNHSKAENAGDSSIYQPDTDDDDGGVPLYSNQDRSVKSEPTKHKGE